MSRFTLRLPEDFPLQPNRDGPSNGTVREKDFTIADDLLKMPKAQDPEYVKACLAAFKDRVNEGHEPFGRTAVPAPKRGQPVFLMGGHLTPAEQLPGADLRGKAFGAWLGGQLRDDIASTHAMQIPLSGAPHLVTMRELTLAQQDVVRAGFRPVEGVFAGFSNLPHGFLDFYQRHLPEWKGEGKFPSEWFNRLKYNEGTPFENATGWGLYHAAGKQIAPEARSRAPRNSGDLNYQSHGVILNPLDGGESIKVQFIGHSRI